MTFNFGSKDFDPSNIFNQAKLGDWIPENINDEDPPVEQFSSIDDLREHVHKEEATKENSIWKRKGVSASESH